MRSRQLFVVGNSRSGTTMLAKMFGLHPDIHTLLELHFFEEMWDRPDAARVLTQSDAVDLAERLLHNAREWYHRRREPGALTAEARELVQGMPGPLLAHAVFAEVLRVEADRHGATVACEQTPRNVFYLDEIRHLLPEAHIVTLVRDPRDVLLSQKNWWRRRFRGTTGVPLTTTVRQWVDYHPLTTSLLWRGGVRAADRHPESAHVTHLRYEDVVHDPESQLRRVLDKLDIAFDPRMLEVPRMSSSNASTEAQSGTGVDPAVSGRWRTDLTATEIWVSQRVTGRLARDHGYEMHQVEPGPALLGSIASWPVKSVLATTMNLSRTRNLRSSVVRRLRSSGGSATPLLPNASSSAAGLSDSRPSSPGPTGYGTSTPGTPASSDG